ncbi:MAG: ATP-binding protein [bacterium]|nr:ATP-binding protein [bacterium]
MTPTVETINLEIPCASDFVGVVRLAVSGIATRMNFSIEEIEDIKIAVSEACTNSVQYAYEDKSQGRVYITCNLYKEKLEIIVEDHGKGFDMSEVEAIKANKEGEPMGDERSSLGLGMTFIKSLMDVADFNSTKGKGTSVRMAKHI